MWFRDEQKLPHITLGQLREAIYGADWLRWTEVSWCESQLAMVGWPKRRPNHRIQMPEVPEISWNSWSAFSHSNWRLVPLEFQVPSGFAPRKMNARIVELMYLPRWRPLLLDVLLTVSHSVNFVLSPLMKEFYRDTFMIITDDPITSIFMTQTNTLMVLV